MGEFQQIFGKFVRTGSSNFPWLLTAEVLANETKMNNELLLHVRSLDMCPKREVLGKGQLLHC